MTENQNTVHSVWITVLNGKFKNALRAIITSRNMTQPVHHRYWYWYR